jgi:hypothetical protein
MDCDRLCPGTITVLAHVFTVVGSEIVCVVLTAIGTKGDSKFTVCSGGLEISEAVGCAC